MEIVRQSAKELDNFLLESLMSSYAEGMRDFLIPAGGTPESFYKFLSNQDKEVLREANFWQIDDIISGPLEDTFYHFFKKNLGKRIDQLIKIKDVLHLPKKKYSSFLGLGVNGHVAFHEPHIPAQFGLGCVELGEETLNYLDLKGPTWGLTFGLETFLKSEKIYLMVKGGHKSKILHRFLNDDPSVPAVHLKKHANLCLMLDDEVSLDLPELSSKYSKSQLSA